MDKSAAGKQIEIKGHEIIRRQKQHDLERGVFFVGNMDHRSQKICIQGVKLDRPCH